MFTAEARRKSKALPLRAQRNTEGKRKNSPVVQRAHPLLRKGVGHPLHGED